MTTARFGTSAISASGTADAVSVTAEQPPPGEVAERPGAEPHADRQADQDRREHEAEPGGAAVERVLGCRMEPRPITTPAAQNAPSIPITRPRTTGVFLMNRQPSQMALAVDGTEIGSLLLAACRSAAGSRR